MKKHGMLAALLVLTLLVTTGCGCRNSKPVPTTVPTTMPIATTMPTEASSIPTTMATEATTSPTIQDGNGPISTDATENDMSRSRNGGMIGSGNGITGSITG